MKYSSDFRLLRVEFGGVRVDRLVGGGLELRLLIGLHGVPDLRADRHDVVADDVAREHELRRHLVELHELAGDKRVVLAVDGAGLQRGVQFGIGDRRRIGAERLAEELPELARRHSQLDALHVRRRLDRLVRLQVDAARTEIDRRNDLDAKLVLGHLDEFLADIALERLVHVVGIAEQVGRGQQRPGRDLFGDIRRREVAEIEIVALEGDELGTLLEQRVAPIRLEVEIVLDGRAEGLVGLGPRVGFGEGAAEPELGFALGPCGIQNNAGKAGRSSPGQQ